MFDEIVHLCKSESRRKGEKSFNDSVQGLKQLILYNEELQKISFKLVHCNKVSYNISFKFVHCNEELYNMSFELVPTL